MLERSAERERGASMRTNLLMATISGLTALAMNSVHGGSISGICSWMVLQAPELMQHIAWRDLSVVTGAVHACNWLGAVLLMTVIVVVSRR